MHPAVGSSRDVVPVRRLTTLRHVNSESDADTDRTLRGLVLLVLGAVVLGGALDLLMDAPQNWLSVHVVAEIVLMVVSTATGLLLWRAWDTATSARIATARSLTQVDEDRRLWRQRAEASRQGLRQAVDAQFETWGLTPTEREVALLLLKGTGHKQIAAATQRSASTVRQHAVAVYSKSGQDGRAELAAFFLEGLLHPHEQRE
jgi:DNA-binding CsgD family transcriptional regulator